MPTPTTPSGTDPDLIAASRAQARADADAARRKRARSRVYRRGGYLMIGLILLTALLSVVYVLANRHQASEAERGLVFVIPKGASANVEVPTIDSAIAIPPGSPSRRESRRSSRSATRIRSRTGPVPG